MAGWVLQCGGAAAFPVADPTNPGVVPMGADLAQPDVADLQHQMQLLSGFASAGAGWTILPRVSLEEQFDDNVLEESAPRKADLITVLAPGVSILGDLPRIQIRLDYQPTVEMHVKEGSQNVLTQQFNADGLITAVQDALFVDVRGVSGSQATEGGIGGLGGLGQAGIGPITAGTLTGTDQLGLSKENRSLTTSLTVSPYLLHHFGDYGDGKLGVSLNQSSSEETTGFAPIPLLASGADDLEETILEETATFTSGQRFGKLRDTASANATQTKSSGAGGGTSTRDIGSNRIDYAINSSISVYGTLGWEYVDYSGANRLNLDDMTWSFGTTWTPNQDSSITIGYGHQNGTNSLTFNGRYALTARTTVTGSYTNGIGTQLEQVAGQLDLGAVGNNGDLLNSQTGGTLFAANNALGVAPGVYRYSTLTLGSTTVLDRDSITLNVSSTTETLVGAGNPTTGNSARTATINWARQFTPDFGMNALVSYSTGTPLGTTGSTRSLAARLSLQYTLSDTVTTFASYSYLSREASTQAESFYQDLVIVGITKQF
ncbi:MAG TPA: hypothetical protein VGG99_09225 [Acetobacteraceae bacterium]